MANTLLPSRIGGAVAAVVLLAVAPDAATARLSVGIIPFDVTTVSGASVASGEAVAKLVRIEMIKIVRLQPTLLPAPARNAPVVVPADAPKIDVVLAGTILSADTTQTSRRASTGNLLGGNIGVGGRINRVTSEVTLHVELVSPATGNLVDSFEVQAKSSGTSLGTDFSTALGRFDTDGSTFDNSSLGKALRQAAEKISTELAKRADKLQVH